MIAIYCYNAETEGLRPLAERLMKKGAGVMFHSLKYDETVPDITQVITPDRYVDRVKKIYAGTGINVVGVGAAEKKAPEVTAVVAEEPGVAVTPSFELVAPMEPVVVEEAPIVLAISEADEDTTPAPAPKRRARLTE